MTTPLEGLDVQVDGAQLLDQVCGALRWWVKFPSPEAADAAVLYIAATHAAQRLQFAPRLRVKSPQKRCGKSRLLEVASWLVHDPLKTANISAAALVRSIGDDPPTVMLDEADAVFGKGLKGDEKAEHLRGILNAGFDRGSPYIRWDVTTRALENCPTFALAIIAGIGSLPDTIEDRAVPLVLARKTKDESCVLTTPHAPCSLVHKFRPRRDVPMLITLRDELAAWVLPRAEAIGAAEPAMPDGLNDRAEDVWEALIAVADLAGGTWPQRARSAAVRLMTEAETGGADTSLGMRLLADLLEVFNEAGAEAMYTAEVIARLCKIEESPWRTVNRGMAIDASGLASRLKPYEVRPALIRHGDHVARGYRRADFTEVWSRYLPPTQIGEAVKPVTDVTSQVRPVTGQNVVTGGGVTPLQLQASDEGGNAVTGVTGNPAWTGAGHDFGALWLQADFRDRSGRGDGAYDWED